MIDMAHQADGIPSAAWDRLYQVYTTTNTVTDDEEVAVTHVLVEMLLEEITGYIRHRNACRIANDMRDDAATTAVIEFEDRSILASPPPSQWKLRWWIIRNSVKGLFR